MGTTSRGAGRLGRRGHHVCVGLAATVSSLEIALALEYGPKFSGRVRVPFFFFKSVLEAVLDELY